MFIGTSLKLWYEINIPFCSKEKKAGIINFFYMVQSCYRRFFIRKIGYIYFVPKLVRPSVCLSVTCNVIVSSPKLLDIATSDFVDAKIT